mmetsp:Transcript_7513/g.21374  ORF Transcript_7513/g.21374 Transcript_7513/m.21374 type:complete len:248 (-) Transcript_7513:278-1021(-)
MAALLIPPFQFSFVEEFLYRGAYPTRRNFRFLRRLGLKTIVSLIPKKLSEDLTAFCRDEGIVSHVIMVNQDKGEKLGVGEQDVIRVLELVLDASNYPLYFHSNNGVKLVAPVVACLRKLQGWDLAAIIAEAARITSDSYASHVTSFAESFQGQVTMPMCTPYWVTQPSRAVSGEVVVPAPGNGNGLAAAMGASAGGKNAEKAVESTGGEKGSPPLVSMPERATELPHCLVGATSTASQPMTESTRDW